MKPRSLSDIKNRMRLQIFIIVSIALMLGSSAYSQTDYTVSYYPLIYRAESAIVDNYITEALGNYRSAFRSVDRIFAIDLVNATVCAIKLDSVSLAIDLLQLLILKGISEAYLNEFDGFKEIRGSKEWIELLASYDTLRSSVQFNDRLFVELDSLSEADQKFRLAPGSYSKYGDTISKIDQSNIIFLREVIEKYGFPNEHILGAEYPQISFPSEIVLHHHCQSMSIDKSGTKFNFESDFYQAIQNGDLDPHRMAQLIGMQGQYAPKIGQNTIIYLSLNGSTSQPFREKVNQDMISIIDENRALAGLESQTDYYHKAVFKLLDSRASDYEFKRYEQTETYDVDEPTYNKLLNALEPINIR